MEITENLVNKIYKKRYIWRRRAEELLMELWADKIHELRSARRSGHTYIEMASVLASNHIHVTAEEVKTKLYNWTKKYRAEKRMIGSSRGSPSTWEHFKKINEILGKFKTNNVPNLIEDPLFCESLSERSISMSCEFLPVLPSPSISASRCSQAISTPVINNRTSDQNNTTKIVNSMETALKKQHEPLKKMVDNMREFDKRNFRSSDQNNITNIMNSMETASKKQHEPSKKIVDDMGQTDKRNFRSSDQNNSRKIMNSMETALKKQHEPLEKMIDDMREFDERNFKLLSRLVDSTIETNNAVRDYFMSVANVYPLAHIHLQRRTSSKNP